MKKIFQFEIQSLLNISKKELWKDIWNFENINKEIAPYFKITLPDFSIDEYNVSDIPLNQLLFSSKVLLFKILPVDTHHFKIKSIKEFESFEETSTTSLLNQWNHTRTLKTQNHQTLLTDIVSFNHRINLVGKLTFPIYKNLFEHRHKFLRREYNN